MVRKVIIPCLFSIVALFGVSDMVLATSHTGGVNNATGGTNPTTGGVNNGQSSFEIKNPLKVNSITEFLVAVIEIILVFATPLIVIYIMYAGFLFVTANGEPDQLEKARNALMFAIIGGVIILGVFLIIEIIQNTLVDITKKST